METIIFGNFFVFLAICGYCIFVGLNPKKWSVWVNGFYGFISGFMFGLSKSDIQGGLALGALFAFVVIYGGVTSYWNRQRFKE